MDITIEMDETAVVKPKPHAATRVGSHGLYITALAQYGPRRCHGGTAIVAQAQDSGVLIGNPDRALAVLHNPAGHAARHAGHVHESIVLDVSGTTRRRDPDAAAPISEERKAGLGRHASSCDV